MPWAVMAWDEAVQWPPGEMVCEGEPVGPDGWEVPPVPELGAGDESLDSPDVAPSGPVDVETFNLCAWRSSVCSMTNDLTASFPFVSLS